MSQEDLFQNPLGEQEIDSDLRHGLNETARTARFYSVVAIVSLCMFFIFFIISGLEFAAFFVGLFRTIREESDISILTAGILVFLIFTILLIYYLMTASNQIRTGLATSNQDKLEKGMNALRIYFIIFTVVSVGGLLIKIYGYL